MELPTEEVKERSEEEEGSEEEESGPNVKAWVARLDAAKKSAGDHWKATDDAWREYLGGALNKDNVNESSRYPIYWSAVKTIQPALYSRTPKPVAEKVFDALEDNTARLASICLERLAKYLINCNPYDRVQYANRDEYIHGGKATARVVYSSKISGEEKKRYYYAAPMPIQTPQAPGMPPMAPQTPMYLAEDDGSPLPQGIQLQEDENGLYALGTEEYLDEAKIELAPVNYRDILHTPNARHHEEITWMAYKLLMDKREVRERFPGFENKISFSDFKAADDDNDGSTNLTNENIESPLQYATIWEIWDKVERKVYWYAEGYANEMLDIKEDPYELVGFFPSPPFMLGTVGSDSLYPVPDYVQLSSIIKQLHALSNRLRKLIKASQLRGAYDSEAVGIENLAELSDEVSFLAIPNFREIIGDRGLESIFKFFPTDKIVQAIAQKSELIAMFDAKFNEMYGVPDVLRGVSDPRETAAAQQQKGRFLSLRFSSVQREFQRLNRDQIELMCDLALKRLPDAMLAEVMGYKFMEQQDQMNFPQVLALLKDDTQRKIRIDIETDSTITMNEGEEVEQRNFLAQTLFNGIQAIGTTKQQAPELLPVVANAFLYLVRGVRDGKQIEESLEQKIAEMNQPKPPAPMPPDPTIQKAQIDQQTQLQKAQMDQQASMAKLQMQAQEMQMRAQELQLEFQKLMKEAATAQEKNAIEQSKLALDSFVKQQDAMIKEQRLMMDREYLTLDMQEKFIEEQRLAQQNQIETLQALKPERPEKEAPGVVNVNVAPENMGGIY